MFMFNIEFVILNTVMSLLSAFMVYYMLSKKAEKTIEFYTNKLKNDVEKWLNSETGVKALYSLGALIGNGAKDSIGIGTKGGKFKFSDLLTQIGINWASKNLPGLNLASPGDLPQELNIKTEQKRNVLGSA